ncbi:MAG: MFS transporter [Pirellulales bacterium]|nr:MFS transporter [Pirellulales bacterium]
MHPRIFGFLSVSPDAEPISDPRLVRDLYRYWRLRVLYATTIGYVAFYFVRKSLAVAMPVIEEEFQIPKSQLGLMITLFGLTYGISKFVNGFVGDRSNPRYFMAIGLLASALVNIFFGLSSGIVAFCIFWILNGWFQGMGWAPCSRTLVNWFSSTERGFKFSICNTSVSIGSALVVFLNGYLIVKYGWRHCFFVPAGIAWIGFLFILNRLRDRPQSLGLPPVEQYTGDALDVGDTKDGKGMTYQQIVRQYIFLNPSMWLLCFAQFFVYVIRYTILDWGTTFLKEARGLEILQASWIIGGYEVAGVAGMLIGGLVMDKLFKGNGGKTCAIYLGLCTICILFFWKFPIQTLIGNGILLWSTGFLVYGPQCLIGVAAANMVPKNAGAAAVGLTGLFGYLSTVLSGWGLGFIVQYLGWDVGLRILVLSGIEGTLLLLLLWNSKPLVSEETNDQNAREA